MSQPVHYHYGKFPPKDLDWNKLIPLIGPTSVALARYDGVLSAVPNPTILFTPFTTQEAVLSSKIEGTVTTITEVLKFEISKAEKDPGSEKTADIKEVLNYRKAMRHAVDLMKKLPLCQRVVKETHEILLRGVRGKDKSPGEYRTDQNWIGVRGCPIEEARFVPISPDKLQESVNAWEKFIHADFSDELVKLAILHVEFESIHPFNDGNGRMGRMLVPLFLQSKKILKTPMFYISEYFEKNHEEYYNRLLSVSRENAWTDWCVFFMNAILTQAQVNQSKVKAILKLYEEKKSWIIGLTHSQHAIKALDYFFKYPIFLSSDFSKKSGIPAPTAKRILSLLSKNDTFATLDESRGRKPATLAFRELLNIAEGRKVFADHE